MKERNLYKKKFRDKKAPIDKAQLWEQITSHTDFPKKETGNRGNLYFLSLLVFTLTGICIFLLSTRNEATELSHKKTTLSSNSLERQEGKPSTISREKHQEASSDNILTRDFTKLKKTASLTQTLNLNNNTFSSSPEISKAKVIIKTNSIIEEVKFKIDSKYKPVSHPTPISTYDKTQPKISPSNKIEAITNNFNSVLSSSKNHHRKDSKAINKSKISKEFRRPANFIDLPKNNNLLFSEERILSQQNKSIILLPLFKNPKWIIGLAMGSGKSNHSLRSLNREVETTSLRINHSKDRETQFASLSVQRLLPYNFSIAVEGEIENLYQRFDLISSETTIARNDNFSQGFYSYYTSSIDYELYHQYHFLNLNLLAYKTIPFRAVEVSIGAGVVYNISFNAKGEVPIGLEEFINLESLKEYKERTNLSYLGSIALDLKLTKRWTLRSDLRYKSNSVLTSANQVFDHEVFGWKLGLGLAYRI